MKSEPSRIANHQAALRWGGFIVALLTLQVLAGVVAIVLATSDPSAAVLPDYYGKALRWDEQQEAEAVSRELGWTLSLAPFVEQGKTGLSGRLVSGDGQPVSIASGKLELYHHARASEIDQISLPANDQGLFAVDGCITLEGLWQANVELVDPQGHRFVNSQVVMIKFSGSEKGSDPLAGRRGSDPFSDKFSDPSIDQGE